MTMTARTCRVCRSDFEYDAQRFVGFRPPCLCSACNAERRARLCNAEGVVVQLKETGAVVQSDTGGVYFWRFFGMMAEPRADNRPRIGDRISFRYDPEEIDKREAGSLARLPLVRNPHLTQMATR